MKFLVDKPLGGLAKWLRFCGFDTGYQSLSPAKPGSLPPPAPDTCILTSQAALARLRRPDILVLAATTPMAQLKEVLRRLKISRRQLAPLSRCVRCNDLLVPISRDQVQGLVPEHVFQYQAEFYQCPRCHRLFWPGSHLTPISARLEQALRRKSKGPLRETTTPGSQF
jgi:uncharacterized protein with PIN domain